VGELHVVPGGPLRGSCTVPGDKSISHRALFLAAIARGTCAIDDLAPGEDVRSTAACLAALGARIALRGGGAMVQGGALSPPRDVLFCGNSGTTARLLAALTAGAGTGGRLDGDASLRARPMRRVLDPLAAMGAHFTGERLPLEVAAGQTLHGAAHVLPVASAQVKTALLLAGLHASGITSVREPAPSRDHTERMLPAFGVELLRENGAIAVRGPVRPVAPPSLRVPGDPSSAAFVLAAALLVPGSDVTVTGVGLNPTRTGFLRVLARMGAELEVTPEGDAGGEPVGRIRARHGPLSATTVGAEEIPALIDEVPLLAAIATAADGRTEIRGAGELRVKESDRLARVAAGLTALGARVEELPDGLAIDGPSPLSGARVDGSPDHRLVMTFAVAALRARGASAIDGAAWAAISFPTFAATLARLGADVRGS
jgi:3-phosphoshikimate 1-carboxyvinyltransferase